MKQQTLRWVKSLLPATIIALSLGATAPAITLDEYVMPTSNSSPFQIIVGPHRTLWFTEFAAGKIGRITTGGAITEFSLPNPGDSPSPLIPGKDANLWHAVAGRTIGKRSTRAVVTECPLPVG